MALCPMLCKITKLDQKQIGLIKCFSAALKQWASIYTNALNAVNPQNLSDNEYFFHNPPSGT
jgi:hypothetical protein